MMFDEGDAGNLKKITRVGCRRVSMPSGIVVSDKGELTFVQIRESPGALGVPKGGQNAESHDIVTAERFGVLENEGAGALSPFNHEAMVSKGCFAISITVETRGEWSGPMLMLGGGLGIQYLAA